MEMCDSDDLDGGLQYSDCEDSANVRSKAKAEKKARRKHLGVKKASKYV